VTDHEEGRPTRVDAPTERVVRVPEATSPEATSPEATSGELHPAPEREAGPLVTRSRAPWVAALALAMLAAVTLLALVIAPDLDAVPERSTGAGAEAPLVPEGSGLTLRTPDTLRTHTVNAAGDQDLLALSASGVDSLERFEGAPVTADGVTVATAYSETVFTVSSPTGGQLVVLVPYEAGTRVLTLAENEGLTFNGTLMPVLDDFGEFAGAEAGAVATGTGSYILAVPETIAVVPAADTLVS